MALDKTRCLWYNFRNFIGQFVTILSVNKTRESDGRVALIFLFMGADCAHFFMFGEPLCVKKSKC